MSAAVESLTVGSGEVSADLTGFVVRVDLSHLSAGWWTQAVAEGVGAIRVKQAGTVIPFDVVWTNTGTSTGELFFRAPTIYTASANVFTVEIVAGASALATTDPNGRDAVWVDYDVMLAGIPSSSTLINRKGGAAFTVVGTTPTGASDGMVNFGSTSVTTLYLDGLAQRSVYTLGVSVYPTTVTGSPNKAAISYTVQGSTATGTRTGIAIDVGTSSRAGVWNSTDSWRYLSASSTPANALHRWNVTLNGTTQALGYLDGALGFTDNTISARPTSTPCELVLGASTRTGGGGSERWQGRLNYAYLRNSVLSAAWLAGEVSSWHAPAGFYTVATISPPGPPTSLSDTPDVDHVVLTWAAPVTGGTPTGYDVRRDGGSPTDVGLVLSHDFTGLAPATAYTLETRAYNAAGTSSWASVSSETLPAGPEVPYEVKVRIGDHFWNIEAGDTLDPDGPEILAGASFTWAAPDNVGWPPPLETQDRDILSLQIYVATAAEVGDVQRGQPVRFKFTPEGYLYTDPLIDFAGRVSTLKIVDHPAGGVILSIVAVDYLVDLMNWTVHDGSSDWVIAHAIGGDDMGDEVTTFCEALDTIALSVGGYPFPVFGDVLYGIDTSDPSMFGFPAEDIVLSEGQPASAYDGFRALGMIPWPNFDDDGDLDPTHPYLLYPFVYGGVTLVPRLISAYGFDFETADPLSACLVPNDSVRWARDYTPTVVQTPLPGLLGYIEHTQGSTYGATPPAPTDLDRVLYRTAGAFNTAGLANELPESDPWGMVEFLIQGWEDPNVVRGFFTYPDRVRLCITVGDIETDKDPNGTGTVGGMLRGAAFVAGPQGEWTVTAGMRRSRPDMTYA